MNDKLYNLLLRLPKKNLFHLMLSALNEMQLYNGQTLESCIIAAAGGGTDPVSNMYKLPSLQEIKVNTENFPLL